MVGTAGKFAAGGGVSGGGWLGVATAPAATDDKRAVATSTSVAPGSCGKGNGEEGAAGANTASCIIFRLLSMLPTKGVATPCPVSSTLMMAMGAVPVEPASVIGTADVAL